MRRSLLGLLLVACACAGARAVEYNNVVSVGDSLLDDILGLRSPLVSEQLSDRLDVPLTAFSQAGSTSAAMLRQGQLTDAAAQFGAGDLATLWIGGNDFFASALNPFGVGIGNFRFMDRLEDNVDEALGTLRSAGMDVVVFNLPDMAKVPFTKTITLFDFQLEHISLATTEWNTRLEILAEEHGAHLVDIYGLFEEVAANPVEFTVNGNEFIFGPDWGCKWCVFSDLIHPSAAAQGMITNAAIEVLNAEIGGEALVPITDAELQDLADLYDENPFVVWRAAFDRYRQGDFDDDGDTDGHDFLLLQRLRDRLGQKTANSTAIPEPTTLALTLGVFLVLGRSISRRC